MATKTFTIHQAKTHLSRLIEAALRGEEVVIAKGKRPVVRLEPITAELPPRRTGWIAGEATMSDDFDAPLDDFDEYMR